MELTVSVLCLFTVDGGSAALYTKQENELFIMNCDIDGASAHVQFTRDHVTLR